MTELLDRYRLPIRVCLEDWMPGQEIRPKAPPCDLVHLDLVGLTVWVHIHGTDPRFALQADARGVLLQLSAPRGRR